MESILILEDDPSVNRGISFSIEKAGYQVISCYTIAEAQNETREIKPNVVICDINLPDGSGLDFIQWIRKECTSYIICLTAYDQELDQVMGYEAGADDYITKPFSLAVLMLKIEAYFKRNKKQEVNQVIHSGDVCVRKKEMKVQVKDREVSLTKNEWKMLLFFLNHPKQILSKKQMLESIFDIDGEFVDENTLAVNIRRLREKIEDDPAKPIYIKNIRGLGYVWNVEVCE